MNFFTSAAPITAALLLATALAPMATSAKVTSSGGSSGAGLALVSSNVEGYAPTQCFHEDSINQRTWTGSLAPGASMGLPMDYCTLSIDGVDPGGATLFISAQGSGSVSLSATSPSGASYPAHTVNGSSNLSTVGRCFGYIPGSSSTIEPGTWTVSITNNGATTVKNITLQVDAMQEWEFMWPQFGCPRQDWNYTPATVVSPSAGATVTGTVKVVGVASTRIPGYNKMEFYVDGSLVGSVDTTPYFLAGAACSNMAPAQCPIAYSWNTSAYRTDSSHTLLVKDYSGSGDTSTSDPVTVTVHN